MSQFLSAHRFAVAVACLLFVGVFLTAESDAWASTRTYTILDHPSSEYDLMYSVTDSVTGTIITDGNLGTLTDSDILGGDIQLTCPHSGTYDIPLTPPTDLQIAGLLATPYQLLLPPPSSQSSDNAFSATTASGGYYWGEIEYQRVLYGTDVLYGEGGEHWGTTWERDLIFDTPGSDPAPLSGQDPWVIAAIVPEPATLTLLSMALLGLGVVYLRRRRGAKA